MSGNISTLGTPTISHSKPANSSTPTSRISSAEKLSITPESQMDLAAIFSLNGEISTPIDLGLGSLIYNASVAISGTADNSLPKTDLVEEQIRAIIDAYSPVTKT